jgi:hypothetical protein
VADTYTSDTGTLTAGGNDVQTNVTPYIPDAGVDLPAEMARMRESAAAQEARIRASGADPQTIERQVATLHASLAFQAQRFGALQAQRNAEDAERIARWRTAVAK